MQATEFIYELHDDVATINVQGSSSLYNNDVRLKLSCDHLELCSEKFRPKELTITDETKLKFSEPIKLRLVEDDDAKKSSPAR